MKSARIAPLAPPGAKPEDSNQTFRVVRGQGKKRFWNSRKVMALFESYRKTQDPSIRDQIFDEYAGLASIYAWKYSDRGADVEDLRQEGCLGLLKAIEGFDPSRGVQFHTYAIYFVEGHIRQYFRDKTWACHVPRSMKVMAFRVKKLSSELGRLPTKQEAVNLCGIPENKVDEALEAARAWGYLSFCHGESDLFFASIFVNEVSYIDHNLESAPLRLDIQEISQNRLSSTEARIMKMFYEDDLSQREIACRLGTYQMLVSRTLQRSTRKIGVELSEKGKMAC